MFGSCQSLWIFFFFSFSLYDFAMYDLVQRAPEHVNNDKSGGYTGLLSKSFKREHHSREVFILLHALF